MSEAIQILHVDDDPLVLSTTADALEAKNERFEVYTAKNATIARQLVQFEQIDCIVSDYGMPGQDGLEFLHAVREEQPSLPFILFTGKGSEEVASEAFSAGATDYVQKDGGVGQYTVLANSIENTVSKHRAEKRSREENRRRKQMLDRFIDGYVALDAELRFTQVNESAAEFLEQSVDDLLGERYEDILLDSGHTTFYEAFERVLETQTPETVEARSGVKASHWVEARIFPIEDGLSVYFRNVTEQTEYERELEEKNERLTQFARIVSHDLRNPLNVAQLRLTLARDECDTPHLDDIENAHDRMETIIDETLILTRQDERVDERERVDIGTIAREGWSGVATGSADLVVEEPPQLRADADRLRHVFENLFRNAVEHAGETATVEVGGLADGFYIGDNGPGVPDDVQSDLFEFGTTSTEDGTGYGLAIVEEVVTAHGWEIALGETVPDDEKPMTPTGTQHSCPAGSCFEITGVDVVEYSR